MLRTCMWRGFISLNRPRSSKLPTRCGTPCEHLPPRLENWRNTMRRLRFLGAPALCSACPSGSSQLGGNRSCQSALAGKEFSTHLLFARAALQRDRADFVGGAGFEATFHRCHYVLFIQFTGRHIGSGFISIICANPD